MTTILRYGCAALLTLTFVRAGADDRATEQRRHDLHPLLSWSGVIPSSDDTTIDRGSAAPRIQVSASTSAGDMAAGEEQLASWGGEVPEVSGEVHATGAAATTDPRITRQLPSWSGIVPSFSSR